MDKKLPIACHHLFVGLPLGRQGNIWRKSLIEEEDGTHTLIWSRNKPQAA